MRGCQSSGRLIMNKYNIAGTAVWRKVAWVALLPLVASLPIASNTVRKVATSVKNVPTATPDQEGISGERLQRLHQAVAQYVSDGTLPGAVTLVSRNGRVVWLESQGVMDIESKTPMTKDAIFPVFSMTKPMTATAILILMEQGKLRLSDPVSRFIPEFKQPGKVRVLKSGVPAPAPGGRGGYPPESYDIVPASREITIRDLLTHTSGMVSIGVPNPNAPVLQMTDTLTELVPRFAPVPLDFQPGTKWAYSNFAGFDILARIVEIASGQPFGQFLKAMIFDPLGMQDTGFHPKTDQRASRFVSQYQRTPGGLRPQNPPSIAANSTTYTSGSAGLSTTATDYWRFAQMLLNRGELNGNRVLSPNSVDLMTSNQVGDLFPGSSGVPGRGVGFGLSVLVVKDSIAADLRVPDGSFGWDGVGSYRFWVCPKLKMVVVFLGQGNPPIHRDVENAVMQAVID